MQPITVAIDNSVMPEEVLACREEPLNKASLELWHGCIRQSLCVVTARDEDRLVIGVGFLVGNQRHAQIVDLVVHSSARKHGAGGRIFDELVSHARAQQIRYLGLTYDKKFPWLKGFYERHGFRSIDFCMWEKNVLSDIGE